MKAITLFWQFLIQVDPRNPAGADPMDPYSVGSKDPLGDIPLLLQYVIVIVIIFILAVIYDSKKN